MYKRSPAMSESAPQNTPGPKNKRDLAPEVNDEVDRRAPPIAQIIKRMQKQDRRRGRPERWVLIGMGLIVALAVVATIALSALARQRMTAQVRALLDEDRKLLKRKLRAPDLEVEWMGHIDGYQIGKHRWLAAVFHLKSQAATWRIPPLNPAERIPGEDLPDHIALWRDDEAWLYVGQRTWAARHRGMKVNHLYLVYVLDGHRWAAKYYSPIRPTRLGPDPNAPPSIFPRISPVPGKP